MADLSNIKKGDKVIMRLFTGAYSGVKEVEKADKSYISFTTKKGESKFSRKTGKMVEPAPKSERFANFIEPYDPKVEAAEAKKKGNGKGKTEKKSEKTETKKPVEKESKKSTKTVAKKATTESEEND